MKTIYKSKTVWFNFLTVVIVLASASGYTPNAELSNTVSGALLAFSPVVNLVLRYFTTQGITVK